MPAFFRSLVCEFLDTGVEVCLHRLTEALAAAGLELHPDQHAAWSEEWSILREALSSVTAAIATAAEWSILLEYPIAGRGKRIDVVLLTEAGIIVVEFKSGQEVTSAARWQVTEYCWNLRDFHLESRQAPLAPILCVVGCAPTNAAGELRFSDRQQTILDLQICNASTFADALLRAYGLLIQRGYWGVDADAWDRSTVQPSPTVIGFAQRIFSGHDVHEISHAHSENTDAVIKCISEAIAFAKGESQRVICFVTGVPGAGKTLVGLNAAYGETIPCAAGGPVYFASGNQPLLDVLEAAIVRNQATSAASSRETAHDISAPVQNVHELVYDTLSQTDHRPAFHVVVFDEAQRVWNSKKFRSGLAKRKRRKNLDQGTVDRILSHGDSEPELLLSVAEMCPEWCVLIALVGGGQEIHDGEAGLTAWGTALRKRRQPWCCWAADEALKGGTSSARQVLFESEDRGQVDVSVRNDLHLSVSKRSLRAERYAEWVNLVVAGEKDKARTVSQELSEFPVVLVRDLAAGKAVLRERCGGDLRGGLLATSGSLRLRADGIEVSADFRNGISYPDWFLRPAGDIRSCSQLEVAATEFECQGLELDWCCVCWGGEFVYDPQHAEWRVRKLRSTARKPPRWFPEKNEIKQEFVRNKYRVLLTRARVGVVIYVPQGSQDDHTREPRVFDAIAEYLEACGALKAE